MQVGELVRVSYEEAIGIVIEIYDASVEPNAWSVYWFDLQIYTHEYEDELILVKNK